MAEVLSDSMTLLPLRQYSARKPFSASCPRKARTLAPAETACPACGGELSVLGCDVSEQPELISSAFKIIETQRPKLACCRCDHIVQADMPSKPPSAAKQVPACWPTSSWQSSQSLRCTTAGQIYIAVRDWC